MATPGFTHFIVTGIGVREVRSAVGRDPLCVIALAASRLSSRS
jgi:hypothetical protein